MRRLLSSLLIFFLIYFIIPPIVEASDTEIDEEELNIQPNDSIVEEGSLNENSTEKDKTTDGGSSDLHNEENIELIENNEDLTETEIEVEEPADNSDLIQQESIKSNELETEELAVEQVKENTVKSSKENIIKVFSAETSTLSFPFKRGERHEKIVEIKKMLNHIGFGGISETTLFGSWMETRVKQFQSYYGLKVTGEINEKTYEKIKEVYDSPFQLSRRHDETPKLKEKLNRIGYGNISVTTLYGSFMDNRVRKFQRDHGLVVNGIMDEVTLNKLYELSRLTFEPGDRHPNIIDIKKMLNRIGFGGISETTLFGSWMETRVRQLQEYYGLEVTGKVDEATYAKISEVFNSPFQLGKRHEKTPELKEKLNRIGYGNISVTTLYGSFMDNRVRKFQRDHGLRVNGIMDELTQRKLDEVVNNNPFQRGDRHEDIIEVKKKLNHIGFDGISETPLFGSWMETRVKQFQRYYGLPVSGKLDNATLKKLDEVYNSPFQRGKRHNDTIKLKEKLNEIGYGYISVTTLYGSFMEKQVKKFQRDYGLRVNGIIDEVTQKAIDRAYNNRSIKIFLDPGHGGHDPGAKAFNLNEKDVVLDIARETARYLTNNYKGVEVKLSRSTDKYLSLSERTNTANRWSADYYVSFHVNAGRGSGFETYIYNGKVSQETRKRQNDIHTYLAKKINIRDRGQKRANFHVLRETKMPAILLEYMFIDNSTENQLLKNKSYRKQLGRWTAEAIANSFNLKKK